MAKFHIREDGTPGRCWAKPGNCPVNRGDDGIEATHYASKDEANRAYEKKMEDHLVHGTIQKDGTWKHPLAGIPSLGTRETSKAVRLSREVEEGVSEETLSRWRSMDYNSHEAQLAKQIDDFRAGGYGEGQLANLMINTGTVANYYAEKDLRELSKERAEIEMAEEINALRDKMVNRNREILSDSGVAAPEGFDSGSFGIDSVTVDPGRKDEIDGKIAMIKRDLPVFQKLHEGWKSIGDSSSGEPIQKED